MGLLCVVLFLQVSHEAHLEPVDVLDVPKDNFQLVIVEHVYTFPALTQIPLQQHEPQFTARPAKIKLRKFTMWPTVQVPLSLKKKLVFKKNIENCVYKNTIIFRLVQNKQKRICLEAKCECGSVKNQKFLGSTKRMVHLSYRTHDR